MLSEIKIEQNKQEFLTIMRTIKRAGIDKLIEWLNNPDPKVCDFFIAPSSSNFHGNYKGGLCEHSLNVYHNLLKLRDMYETMMVEIGKTAVKYSDEQCAIVALLHDLCKCQYYKEKIKNFRNDDGQWIQYVGYDIVDKFPFGHGEKSCFLIQKFMQLTGPEALAIRWHMGLEKPAHSNDPTEKKALADSWFICPLAYLLHQADSMSAFLMEDMIDPKERAFK